MLVYTIFKLLTKNNYHGGIQMTSVANFGKVAKINLYKTFSIELIDTLKN